MSDHKKTNFWMTLNLLVGIDWKKNVTEDVEDWLDSVEAKKNLWTPETNSEYKSRVASSDSACSLSSSGLEKEFILQLPEVECSFNHPNIRSRLERLMGSNLVRLTDRKYMLKLHERILEDYIQTMNKRIADREARERDREKSLILAGKIPPQKDMANHPIQLINVYCEKLIAERRAKIKVPKVVIPLYLYLDDTPDPVDSLSIKNGHVFRSSEDALCVPPSEHLAFTDEEDVERGYMFSAQDYEKKQKYENPQVKELADAQTVDQMYTLADEIIGPLKTITKEVTEEEPIF